MKRGELIGAIAVTCRAHDGKKESWVMQCYESLEEPALPVWNWVERVKASRAAFKKVEQRKRFMYIVKVRRKV